jgi:hypothetical protein
VSVKDYDQVISAVLTTDVVDRPGVAGWLNEGGPPQAVLRSGAGSSTRSAAGDPRVDGEPMTMPTWVEDDDEDPDLPKPNNRAEHRIHDREQARKRNRFNGR